MHEREKNAYRFGKPTYTFKEVPLRRNSRASFGKEVRAISIPSRSRLLQGNLYKRFDGHGMVTALQKKKRSVVRVICSKGVVAYCKREDGNEIVIVPGHTLTATCVKMIVGFSSEKGGVVYFYIERSETPKEKEAPSESSTKHTAKELKQAMREARRQIRLKTRKE